MIGSLVPAGSGTRRNSGTKLVPGSPSLERKRNRFGLGTKTLVMIQHPTVGDMTDSAHRCHAILRSTRASRVTPSVPATFVVVSFSGFRLTVF